MFNNLVNDAVFVGGERHTLLNPTYLLAINFSFSTSYKFPCHDIFSLFSVFLLFVSETQTNYVFSFKTPLKQLFQNL